MRLTILLILGIIVVIPLGVVAYRELLRYLRGKYDDR